MWRLIFIQCHHETEAAHKIYMSVLVSVFPTINSKLFVTKGKELKSCIIFTKRAEKLWELGEIMSQAFKAAQTGLTFTMMEPKSMVGFVSNDFGQEAIDEIKDLYREFLKQDSIESVTEKIRNEIKDEKDDK